MKPTLINYRVLLTVFFLIALAFSVEATEETAIPEFDEAVVIEREAFVVEPQQM